jgi:DNA-3-methyladenine glycosylase II
MTPLPIPAPFDFHHTLGFVRGFSPMHGEQDVGTDHLTKALSIDGRAVVFRLRSRSKRDDAGLEVELFTSAPLPARMRDDVLGRIAAVLGAGDDLPAFYAAAANDGAFAPLVDRYRGLRHVRFPSAFEAACWGVINQRIQLHVARRMKAALTRRAGSRLVVDGVEHWAFPEPEAVAALGDAELARLVPGGRRASALKAVARAFVADGGEALLRTASIDDARAWLRSIHGVGPFTTSFVLYRGAGRFDGAALIAPRLVQAAEGLYRRALAGKDVARLVDSYGAWGGYWMLYLWASTFL